MGEPGVTEAMQICQSCTVRVRCLTYALNNNITHGIWGGYTARGRRELANALDYITNMTRAEHHTTQVYTGHTQRGHTDPIAATAADLQMSKATVYHHLRIDRLAKEKTREIVETGDYHRRGQPAAVDSERDA